MNKDPIAMQRAELGRITQGGKKEGGYTKTYFRIPNFSIRLRYSLMSLCCR